MPVNTSITLRKGTSSQWTDTNPVLASGEPGYDLTNRIFKIGDGISPWNELGSLNSKIVRGSFLLNQPSGSFTVDGGYSVGSLDIFLNGVKLSPSGDYVASNGTSFSLTQNAPSGSVIEYLALNPGSSFGFNTNDIINFNSSVSGLLPVTNIVAGSNISIDTNNGIFTINSSVSYSRGWFLS